MITCSDYIYIYIYCGDTYIRNVTERQFWHSPSVARTRIISNVFVFCFLCFVSFSRSFVNKD